MRSLRADPVSGAESRAEVVRALAGLDFEGDLALAQRTRRAVRDAAFAQQEQRLRQRRNIGFALLAMLSLLILLAPAIWSSVEDLLGGEHLADLPAQITFFLLMLLPALLAALIAGWKSERDIHHDRRSF